MSLLNTKPHWCKHAIATNRGWVNPFTQEVLVAIGNLDKRLAAEEPIKVVEPVVETPIVIEPEKVIMQEEVKTRKPYAPRKPKVIGEVVEQDQSRQIIAEVVEYNVDTKVIGE